MKWSNFLLGWNKTNKPLATDTLPQRKSRYLGWYLVKYCRYNRQNILYENLEKLLIHLRIETLSKKLTAAPFGKIIGELRSTKPCFYIYGRWCMSHWGIEMLRIAILWIVVLRVTFVHWKSAVKVSENFPRAHNYTKEVDQFGIKIRRYRKTNRRSWERDSSSWKLILQHTALADFNVSSKLNAD